VRAWREAEARTQRWSGGWWWLRSGALGPARSRARRTHEQALRLLGFAALEPGVAVRPDNLRLSLAELQAELGELGLERGALLARVAELDPASEARARALWSRDEAVFAYRRSLAELAASEARLAKLPEERAMVESFLLGGNVIRALVLDPQLPEPLAPEGLRRDLVRAMRDYDRLGRRAWARFLARFGAPHAAAPAHGERTLALG
jgi:phenylacetic acid degradation operon negative regulatory protein